MAFLIIILSDSFIFVLASSVPDLEFDPHSINFDYVENIVNADGHHIVFYELASTISKKHVAFADTWISDNNDFP